MPKAAIRHDPQEAIGRSPDALILEERIAWVGYYIAMEMYTPERLPLRRIEAIGESLDACIAMLQERGLDPRAFEFTRIGPPY